ncbi:bifunctional phosphoribosyl-AMP cyclohydrolase/phosphoribosyl-ATP diphosphatase HisIE [Sphingosinicella sp. BN140058]|uniref:bifunctional phosphoribosyl-AMP cyclohydrolase/phosphoribosyl-ATP diphosphatase HisIE n=1 Tax=Sphingosinicella sp. BN140058 TaxID=1892855 RepID=UPI001011497C|nr:bifunctional phosphoribosyl-AMP cyclohydrolase/phosphoribosyl-ATP diphosphatase HisIE [Sphingosinicella sp. BN140058]QAY78249.1 bifunctional phosphoribosyl-AMP cyclohydrolase/phosphoribosyl-ATP diphosphatase HisIE [Sphingosinicella sp. BN140058]
MRDRNAPLSAADINALAWEKMDDLLPAAVQDIATGRLLMLGYMNREALAATLSSGFATFYSRSKGRLWMKGETSGNRLAVRSVHEDCDSDALLVRAIPEGPTCHLGTASCFGGEEQGPGWLAELSRIVHDRAVSGEATSYTRRLLAEGNAKIAQKIGEEGVEVALAGVTRDAVGCAEETADLLYHVSVLMEARGYEWTDVVDILRRRHKA